MDFALLRKNPAVRISSSSSGSGALAIAAGEGKRLNNSGVTMFTRTSVHCAERIVATRSSQGERCVSAQTASGYASSRALRIAAMRSGASASRCDNVFIEMGRGAFAVDPRGEDAFLAAAFFTVFFVAILRGFLLIHGTRDLQS